MMFFDNFVGIGKTKIICSDKIKLWIKLDTGKRKEGEKKEK